MGEVNPKKPATLGPSDFETTPLGLGSFFGLLFGMSGHRANPGLGSPPIAKPWHGVQLIAVTFAQLRREDRKQAASLRLVYSSAN